MSIIKCDAASDAKKTRYRIEHANFAHDSFNPIQSFVVYFQQQRLWPMELILKSIFMPLSLQLRHFLRHFTRKTNRAQGWQLVNKQVVAKKPKLFSGFSRDSAHRHTKWIWLHKLII